MTNGKQSTLYPPGWWIKDMLDYWLRLLQQQPGTAPAVGTPAGVNLTGNNSEWFITGMQSGTANSAENESPIQAAVNFFSLAVSFKQAAQLLPDAAERQAMTTSVNNSITKYIDDYCGTLSRPPFHWPWPWPGPLGQPIDPGVGGGDPAAQSSMVASLLIFPLAAQLSLTAQSFLEGGARNDLLEIASRVLHAGLTQTQTSPVSQVSNATR
ncbi:MAG: hypothetical protein ACLQUY_10465, partial [Ktedonobacterales bacterium]